MTLFVIILGLALVLLGLCRPAAGIGLAAAADLIVMEGLPIAGTTVALESLFFVYLALVPVLRWLVDGQNSLASPERLRPFVGFAALFALLCALSSWQGGLNEGAQRILSRLPLWALFGLVPVAMLHSEVGAATVARCLVTAAMLLLLGCLLTGLPSAEDQGGPWRTGYLNPLGHALALGAILAFALSLDSRQRWTWLGLALCLAGGTLLTASRGAIVAGAAGFGVAWWIASAGSARRKVQMAGLAALPVAVALVLTGLVAQGVDRVIHQEASSNLYRYQIMVLATRLFLSHPILGVGLGNLGAATGSNSMDLRSLAIDIVASDNDYARILAELGALGVCLILGWCWILKGRLHGALGQDRRSHGRPNPVRVMGAGIAVFLAVLGLFESVLFSPTGWFYLGFSWSCMGVRRCES